MKTIKTLGLLVLVALMAGSSGCERKKTEPIVETEGYVIGFDPCEANNSNNRGYLIKTTTDTLLTYNFPNDLYDFPSELFQGYITWYLFPLSEQNKYKVKIKYRLAKEEEKIYNVCLGIINTGGFYLYEQIYTLRATTE